ncbi:uncharacterized protein LOC135826135 [Sycon ciliatum]|uniref:uncharacterized protein LOC135826135 n=1 Tax=Sycon ciliatum TaxID=27933 RepID=UPI0031F64F73
MKWFQWITFALVTLLIIELMLVPNETSAFWGRRRRRRSSRRRRSFFRRIAEGVHKVVRSKPFRIASSVVSTVSGIVGIGCCAATPIPPIAPFAAGCCVGTRVIAGVSCGLNTYQAAHDYKEGKTTNAAVGLASAGSSCLEATTGSGALGHAYKGIKALGKKRRRRSTEVQQCPKATHIASDAAKLKMHICTLLELRTACRKVRSTKRYDLLNKVIRSSKAAVLGFAKLIPNRSMFRSLALSSCKRTRMLPTCQPSVLEVRESMRPVIESPGFDPATNPCRLVKSTKPSLTSSQCLKREIYAFFHLTKVLKNIQVDMAQLAPTMA